MDSHKETNLKKNPLPTMSGECTYIFAGVHVSMVLSGYKLDWGGTPRNRSGISWGEPGPGRGSSQRKKRSYYLLSPVKTIPFMHKE